MHCLDRTGIGAQAAAVGVCAQCGAAVCAEVSEQYLTCTEPISPPDGHRATGPAAAVRHLRGTCAAAHRTHAACCPQTAGTVRTS